MRKRRLGGVNTEQDPAAERGGTFVEQAEYLESDAFAAFTEEHPHEKQILQKLCRGGAKLITGPRGCGKTTLLLKAYRKLLEGDSTLPIYVNFKSSLRLEPLYKSQANAMYWFNQWMLYKCYVGLLGTLDDLQVRAPDSLRDTLDKARRATEILELGAQTPSDPESRAPEVSLERLATDIETVMTGTDRARCVLFLDDAAHAFSPEQQRDFFDFFRRIRSQVVAPKAAIYPGVTMMSPSFHVGHDAEEIDVWLDPYSPEYLPFMQSLLERRLRHDVFEDIVGNAGIWRLVCFAAFGMPRALLNMVRRFYGEEENAEGAVPRATATSVVAAIQESYENTVGIFDSLRHKIPMYENFITAGADLLEAMMQSVKAYNKQKSVDRQSVSVAIQMPVSPELSRVLGMLEYAGLLMPERTVSRGVKGRFERYRLHAAGLIARNALLGRKNVRKDLVATALQSRNAHEFTRVTPSNLLRVKDLKERLTLALPACQSCGALRANETAKFCLECGAPLKSVSTFASLVKCGIEELPISETRAKRIREHSNLRTVGDILMDHEHTELRGVPWVGAYWAERIYRYAEEFIA